MKISKLIEHLQERLERHGDIEVVGFWEGITVPIINKKIYLAKNGKLYIDVDEDNFYKKDHAVDPREGDSK